MIRFYPIIVLIQAFCIYHAYTKKTEQKWFWIIIMFPLIGSIFYLYHHFYSRRNLENVTEGIKGSFIQNYAIEKLEEKTKISGTYSNKMELAEEHLKLGNYNRAIEVLESCTGDYENDYTLQAKLLQANYLIEDYERAVQLGNLVIEDEEFQNSDEMVAYAWALYKRDQINLANEVFEKMDLSYSNYKQRLEYVVFLKEAKGNKIAKEKLDEIAEEIQAMDSYERRLNKQIIKEFKYLYKELDK